MVVFEQFGDFTVFLSGDEEIEEEIRKLCFYEKLAIAAVLK